MQYPVITYRLADLPQPFKRTDATYASWEASQAISLANYCLPADTIVSQVSFSSASGGWLNVWGQLLGFPRYPSEADSSYRDRISASLVAPVGSVQAIKIFSLAFFGSPVIVKETPPGYTIQIPSFVTQDQLIRYVAALARVRPAGVPVSLTQSTEAFFFNTYYFWGASGAAGPYFGGTASGAGWPIGANTNNSQPLLPSLILSDPILNGGTAL